MSEIISQVPSYVLIVFGLAILLAIYNLIRNGIEITTNSFTIKSVSDAVIIEKIIEIAYEISYLQSTKRLRQQMKLFEEKINAILEKSIKDYRKLLLNNLELDKEEIFKVEDEEDMDVFKSAVEVVRIKWKDYAREFYRNEITADKNEDDLSNLKKTYLDEVERIRIETLNKYYKDHMGSHNRKVSRNEIYEMFCEKDKLIKLDMAETFNNALLVDRLIEAEKEKKIKELEKFFKGRKKWVQKQ